MLVVQPAQSGAVFLSVPIEHLPINQLLPYPLHVRIDGKFVMFRKAGDVLTSDRVTSLFEKKVQTLFVSKAEWQKYISSLEQKLEFLKDDQPTDDTTFSARSLIFAYAKSFEEEESVPLDTLKKLEKMAHRISKAISKDIALAGKLLRRYSDPSLYFANHALNTCIFSTAIGLKYGLSEADLRELSFAACVANIGLMKVPREILYKPSEPTTAEWKLLRAHPVEGDSILRLMFVPPRVCTAVLQHHERLDGSGYPKGIKGNEISLFARIIAIAETFSSLTSIKPWAAGIPATEAIQKIREQAGRFDPQLLSMSLAR